MPGGACVVTTFQAIDPMRERVIRYDARHWARSFINDLSTLVIPDPDMSGADIEEAQNRIAQAMLAGKH